MKIIVGLGNPGRKYERTRHNAGFMAIDELSSSLGVVVAQEKNHSLIGRVRIHDEEAFLVKPQTYMNDSGRAVAAVLRDQYAALADVIVVHDDLDLPLGSVRVKIAGGHGGHNGLRSIMELLGPDFIRVRIGIGRPDGDLDSADYVLSPFRPEEREEAARSAAKAAEAVRLVITDGPVRAMNSFNQK